LKTWLGLLIAIVAIVLAVIPLSQVSRLQGRFQDMETRLETVDTRMGGVEDTLKGLPGDFSQLSERLRVLEEKGKSHFEEMETLLSTLGEKMDTLTTSLETLREGHSEQQKIVTDTRVRLGEVEKKVASAEEVLKVLPGNLDQLHSRLSVVEEKGKTIGEMESLLNEVSQKVDSLSSSFQEIAATQLKEEQAVKDLQVRLDSQEKRAEELRNSLQVLDEKGQEWVRKLANFENLTQSLLGQIEALQKKVQAVEEHVAARDSGMDVALQELQENLITLRKAFDNLSVDQRFAALLKYVQDKDQEILSSWKNVEEELKGQGVLLQGVEEKFQGELEALKVALEKLRQEVAALKEETEKKLQMLSSAFQDIETLFGEKVKEWETINRDLARVQQEYLPQNRFEELRAVWQERLQAFEESLRGPGNQGERQVAGAGKAAGYRGRSIR
jgi:chromosome segregation ATPase